MAPGGIIGLAPATSQRPSPQRRRDQRGRAPLCAWVRPCAPSEFSFQAQTIRVYRTPDGEPLHIFHTLKFTVHRPNRVMAEVSGDDGSSKLFFDGKTATICSAAQNNTRNIAVPEGDRGMLKEAVGRLGVDSRSPIF